MSQNNNFKTPVSSPRGLSLADPGTPLNQNQLIKNISIKKLKNKRNANVQKGIQKTTNTFRKAIIERNGQQQLHFQTLDENGTWGPANRFGNPLSEYSNNSNTRTMNLNLNSSIKINNKVNGGKRTKKVKRTRSRKLKK